MKTFFKLLLFFLLLIQIQCYPFAEQVSGELLNFNWIMSRNDFYYNSKIDSTTTPYSILLETARDKKGVLSLTTPIDQKGNTQSEISIKINYKTQDCSELYLKLIGIGECEKIISIDTLGLSLNEEWTSVEQSVHLKETLFLKLSIEASGDKLHNAKIWVNTLDILIDGKGISKLKTTKNGIDVSLKKEVITSYSDKELNNLPFSDKKILAIGESIHGTETFNDIAIEIIKYRIIHQNCKFVLMEIPLEFSFYINRYINGDSNFKLNNISDYFDRSLYSDSFLSLIEWMKEYNLHSEKKVFFWGIDINSIQLQSKLELFNFFYTINVTKNNQELKRLCKLLVTTKPSLEEVIDIFETNEGFRNVLTRDETKLIRNCLVLLNHKSDTYANFLNRDKTMYENTEFIINNLLGRDETVTMFCHFGHAAYQGLIERIDDKEWSTLGYYLKNKYNHDYTCIALLTEEGSFLSSTSNSLLKVEHLQSSPQGSLEYLMNMLNANISFLSTEKMNCVDIFKTRYIGNRDVEDQFSFMIPKARMDGVLFIKQVYPIKKKDNILKSDLNINVTIMNSYKEALEKISNNQSY
ncbi:MAG: erythromycin esterase family protein [Paludibacter sp.]|nr:erythromycin esterase family protein [Paludibacter sp.]MDD4198395.1 erythromycin esterase family protein [Paludibacter sp.]MDD4427073.1 erythromycin esterase family protein [Paludibacter sp.]